MGDIMGDIATWVGSIGTVAAFAVAFVQIRRERTERHKRELREWLAAKREHADRVSAWVAGEVLTVSNQSHHLIHDVEIGFDDGSTLTLGHIEPGTTTRPAPGRHGTSAVATLRFTDPRGDRWLRESGGPPTLVEAPGASQGRAGHRDAGRAGGATAR